MLHPPSFSRHLQTQFCGRYLLQLATVDSTNRVLAQWEKTGLQSGQPLPEGTTLIATQQTAGRGQRGHTWISATGGLYCSVLLYPQIAPPQALELTLALAWGIAKELRDRLGFDVQLKWPNDLLVGDRKLGGLLLQTRLSSRSVSAVIVGLGLNVNNPTPDIGTSLAEVAGKTLDVNEVAANAMQGIERGYQRWKLAGFSGMKSEYEVLMRYLRSQVQLENEAGTVAGLTSAGALCVLSDRGKRCFYPGEFSLGYAAASDRNPLL